MTWTKRAALALVSAALFGGCRGDEPELPATDATTRTLLNQDVVGGPSTPVQGDAGLAGNVTLASIPLLGYNFGSADAPLKLIELSDFGCGYCRQFHQQTFASLHEQFVQSGRIEWKFVPFITGMFDNSLAVTEAAECVLEQDRDLFEAFSDRLWVRQPDWKGSADALGVVRGWVRELEADVDAFDACLSDDRRLGRVANATALARELGVRGTPTFWLVGHQAPQQ
jgi:protein-disulfide isomerase